jgi:hypothetical protein
MKISKTAEGLRFDPAFEHLRPEYVVKLFKPGLAQLVEQLTVVVL